MWIMKLKRNRKPISEATKLKISLKLKGRKLPLETRIKMSIAHKGKMPKNNGVTFGQKGRIVSEETRRKISEATKGNKHHNFGKTASAETRAKLSVASKGRRHSKETREKLSALQKGRTSYWKGKKRSEEFRRKLSESQRGEKGNNWQGGKNKIHKAIRGSVEYKIWREKIFERDNWTCCGCEKRGGYIQADHIKPFSLFPDLRFELSNGRTLCIECHKKTDTYGWKLINKK